MLTNGGEARVLGENSPLALALPKALGRAIVSESETRSDCIKSSLVVIISVTCMQELELASCCPLQALFKRWRPRYDRASPRCVLSDAQKVARMRDSEAI